MLKLAIKLPLILISVNLFACRNFFICRRSTTERQRVMTHR
jgi:hypothetical protein